MKKVETHLGTRNEERYIFKDKKEIYDFLEKNNFTSKKYSDNPITFTLYFNVPLEPLPFTSSIKLRTYKKERYSVSKPLTLNPDDEYFFEIKKSIPGDRGYLKKEKQRYQGTLSEITEYLRKEYHNEIQPVLALQYEREHFLSPDEETRITVDEPVDFFIFFNNELKGEYIGSEQNGTRVEVKSKQENFLPRFISQDIHFFPTISKGCSGFNFMCNAYEQRYAKQPLYKELLGTEIESKLDVESQETDTLFVEIKKLFNTGVGKYQTSQTYPWIHTSASINRYCRDNNDSLLKCSCCDARVKVTQKNIGLHLANHLNLSCILKRTEIKGQWESIWENNEINTLESSGEFLRIRQAFWPINTETKRIFHINYDTCMATNGKKLKQIEVEYVACLEENKTNLDPSLIEKEIIADIAEITKIILDNFNGIQESVLRKEDFLLK